ncbi:unnamed protein product [Eruca vesicaria subsp. sativa]|uniref:Uncharacterized protein n=1 Tax=Eruca vesicaria subsp. sativa TaxID=29727 RepID=A0ABC8K1P3_ERUVS|nr:unnamed protein product [Eruca vesicaria subsp. sativa]
MQTLRSFSTRTRSRRGGYERVSDDSTFSLLGAKLRRSTSVPYYAPSIKLGAGGVPTILEELPHQKSKKVKATSKFSHPIFSFLYGKKKKPSTTRKPEFSRYLEYLKEGGMWDARTNTPVIYYK